MTLNEIELYFETFGHPENDTELMPGVTIKAGDGEKFVTDTIITLRAHSGDKNYMPYYNMLLKYFNKVRWNQ